MTEPRESTRYVGIRLKVGGLAHIDEQAAKYHDGDRTAQIRRMLRYATENMPEAWNAKRSVTTDTTTTEDSSDGKQ